MGTWTWAAARCRGTSHAASGTRCQDAVSCSSVADGHERLIAVICDGAGSTSKGGVGAAVTARLLRQRATSFVNSRDSGPDDEVIHSWIDEARDAIGQMANRHALRRRDFASTLVGIISDGRETTVIHIGDGGVAAQDAHDQGWRTLSWPTHGEYASTTYFVTDDPAPRTRIVRYQGDLGAIVAFSDGLERLALDFAQAQPFGPFFHGITKPLRSSVAKGRDGPLCRSMATYLDSPVINARTDDDKSSFGSGLSMTLQPLFIDGKPLRLGQRIGKGGEGEVFALADEPSRAVKLYTISDLATREAKVAAMLRKNLAASSGNIAFPVAAVRDKAGRFKGFLMPLVRGHLPIFELYSPGARKQSFPKADYRFLVRAALNAARAVAAVHKAGCVIGDINHSGILISGESATAALIDADSFQVVDGVERYLCRVGVPDYTPPELQGISLSSVVRTPNHDAFGLAIVVFLMLAMGRHPFVGRYTKGEMPIEKAIAEFRFAFSQMRDVGMTPPPGANSLMDFTPSIAAAFESAFSRASRDNRPTSSQWVSLLEEFERSLKPCTDNRLHSYSSTASACPWCRMEKALRIALFLPDYTGGFTDPLSGVAFNLAVLWAQVEAVRLPLSNQLAPKVPSLSPQPSATAQAAKRKQTEPSLYRIAGTLSQAG